VTSSVSFDMGIPSDHPHALRNRLCFEKETQNSTKLREDYMMLNHIPALASAFVGGVLLYLSIYLPFQSIIFPTILEPVPP
jgi:hypothetical protein